MKSSLYFIIRNNVISERSFKEPVEKQLLSV